MLILEENCLSDTLGTRVLQFYVLNVANLLKDYFILLSGGRRVCCALVERLQHSGCWGQGKKDSQIALCQTENQKKDKMLEPPAISNEEIKKK